MHPKQSRMGGTKQKKEKKCAKVEENERSRGFIKDSNHSTGKDASEQLTMLIMAPTGRTNLVYFGFTPLFSSTHLNVIGKVAALKTSKK